MRRAKDALAGTILGLAVALPLLLAASALALPYKTGLYEAGSQTGTGLGDTGVTLHVKRHSFAVERISFPERCSNGTSSFTDEFTFLAGYQAKLTGRIDRGGDFSDTYRSNGDKVTVSGHLHGGKARVKGSEISTYTPSGASGPYTCRGAHTFRARHLTVRGG